MPIRPLTLRVLAFCALFFLSFTANLPARADVESELRTFFNGFQNNVNRADAYASQSGGYASLGSLYARTQPASITPITLNLPSYEGGCGGLDIFAGGFSHINAQQFIDFAEAVARNGASFAFYLALETVSPAIKGVMEQLQELADYVNRFNLNSCEVASAAVGSLWPANDTTSRHICETLGVGNGTFSDHAAAKHGCGSGGDRRDTLANLPASDKEELFVGNITWQAIQKNSFLSANEDLAELVMTIVGSFIIEEPASNTAPIVFEYYQPVPLEGETVANMLRGGQVNVYDCNPGTPPPPAGECLNPVLTVQTIAPADSLAGMAREVITRLLENVRTDTAPAAADFAILSATSLPLYRMLNVSSAYQGTAAALDADALGELVALDILVQFIERAQSEVERGLYGLNRIPQAKRELFREHLRTNRAALTRFRQSIDTNFSRTLNVMAYVSTLEQKLASSLPARLQENLAFESGRE